MTFEAQRNDVGFQAEAETNQWKVPAVSRHRSNKEASDPTSPPAGLKLSRFERLVLGHIRPRKGERKPANKHLIRLREIERIIKNRHGQFIPETDDADAYFLAAAHSLNAMLGDSAEMALRAWIRRYAPWALPRAADVIRPVLYKVEGWKWDLSADNVATLLNVTRAEREGWKINTIGIAGVTKAQREKEAAARKRDRDRIAAAERRRKNGATPRSQSISQTKAWIAAGFKTRRSWERAGKPPVVNSSRVDILPRGGGDDEFATRGSSKSVADGVVVSSVRAGIPSFESLNGAGSTIFSAGRDHVERGALRERTSDDLETGGTNGEEGLGKAA